MLELEWDEEKRRANIRKHGLDFADVKHLDWDDATYIEDTRYPYPEPRFWAFALWKHRLHLVAFCRRGAKVRIISFRKASRKEVKRHGK
jgi:uncharacterized DUF497 family protein